MATDTINKPLWLEEPRITKSKSGRKVSLDWLLGEDERGKRTYATLTVIYNKGGANMFSGTHEQRCFQAALGHETEEDSNLGGVVRGFKLFSAIRIWHSEPVARFSDKKLDEAVSLALAALRKRCEQGDARVLSVFEAA